MQRLANAQICKWAFTLGLRYVGGLPVHTTYMKRALGQAEALGHELGAAAKEDARGRKEYPDRQRYVDYLDKPWSALEPYLDNLSNGTMEYASSLVAEAQASFKREEAVELVERAKEPFEDALALYNQKNPEAACDRLVHASSLWTHATWKEYLEEDIIKAEVPKAYRPLDEN